MNYDPANIGGFSMLYGVKVADPQPDVRIKWVESENGILPFSFEEPFPWELALVFGILFVLLGLLFADAVYHVTAMTKATRIFGATMIGAMLGAILVPFIADLRSFVKAKFR